MAKQFEYEQQLEHLKMSVEDIKTMLESKPVLYAYIVHDMDTDTEPHLHVMCKLLNSDMQPKDLCKWFKDEPQYINIKQSRWGSKLSYLCHRTPKDRDKYQYDPREVVANFDYVTELEKITKEVDQAKSINEIIDGIRDGDIREFNLTDNVSIETFTRYKRKIIDALEWYRRKVMTDKDRNIEVVIYCGPTGTYKTTYAKEYCKNAHKSYCISSSSNDPMQDYKGEQVLILDDLRDDVFKFVDLLKILDNHTGSTISSRYSNKAFLGDTIIITSSKDILEWYKFERQEDRDQLFRRVRTRMVFDNKEINVYEFDEKEKKYEFRAKVPNLAKYTEQEKKEFVVDMLKKMGVQLSEDVEKQMMKGHVTNDDLFSDDELPF